MNQDYDWKGADDYKYNNNNNAMMNAQCPLLKLGLWLDQNCQLYSHKNKKVLGIDADDDDD